MDRGAVRSIEADSAVAPFAEGLRQDIGATAVYVRLPTCCEDDTDFEFTVISPQFSGPWSPYRGNALVERWYALGGKHPVRILCLTPHELDQFRSSVAVTQMLDGAERVV